MKVLLQQSTFKPTHAQLMFLNEGAEPLTLVKPRIGFNRGGGLDGDYFEFDCAPTFKGGPRPVEGAAAYAPEELLVVAPNHGQPVTAIALDEYYELPAAGSFKVRYVDGPNTSEWAEFQL